MRGTASRLLVVATALGVVAALPVAPATAASRTVTWATAKVVRVVDGDTVVTNRGTVRIIGVDAPEQGRKGYADATRWAKSWLTPGESVRLGNPSSVDNKDRYGRLLRYIQDDGRDIGRSLIAKGSRARYDGLDGYDWHPRQADYRALDLRTKNYPVGAVSSGSGGTSSTGTEPWNLPVSATNPDLDCSDIRPKHPNGVRVNSHDYHRLDADGDGWGCE